MTPPAPYNGPERRKRVDPRWLKVSDEICHEQEILIDQMSALKEQIDRIEAKFDAKIEEIEEIERAERIALLSKLSELTLELREYKTLVQTLISANNAKEQFWSQLKQSLISGAVLGALGLVGAALGWLLTHAPLLDAKD